MGPPGKSLHVLLHFAVCRWFMKLLTVQEAAFIAVISLRTSLGNSIISKNDLGV